MRKLAMCNNSSTTITMTTTKMNQRKYDHHKYKNGHYQSPPPMMTLLDGQYTDNVTEILQEILKGYDIRLRPNFGGKSDRIRLNR